MGAAKPRSSPAKPAARDIDAVCRRIVDGQSLTAIAKVEKVSVGSLSEWLEATPERSARARAARMLSARTWDDKATAVIEGAKDSFSLAKAKELAHHYRWRASKIAPRDYGDKLAVGGAEDLPPVQTAPIEEIARRAAFLLTAGAEAAAHPPRVGHPKAPPSNSKTH